MRGCIRVWVRRYAEALSRESFGVAELVPEELSVALLAAGHVHQEGSFLEPFG